MSEIKLETILCASYIINVDIKHTQFYIILQIHITIRRGNLLKNSEIFNLFYFRMLRISPARARASLKILRLLILDSI